MKIFITGAEGYLGSKLYEYLTNELLEHKIVGSFIEENENSALIKLDITSLKEIEKILKREKPNVIIHTAAIAHGKASSNEELLEKVNVNGTYNLIEIAKNIKARFVFISSIGALTNSPYGQSKIVGEKFLKNSGLEYLILRPSPIIGVSPNRKVRITFNKICQAIEKKNEVSEDGTWKFQPSWLNQIAEIIKFWIQGKFKDKEPIYPIIPEEKSRFEICDDILQNFSIKVNKTNNPRYEEAEILTTESLSRNNLAIYNYEQVIKEIVKELKKLNLEEKG